MLDLNVFFEEISFYREIAYIFFFYVFVSEFHIIPRSFNPLCYYICYQVQFFFFCIFEAFEDLTVIFNIHSVIQKDGLNFVRLYFLNYTWHVNDLHNIWYTWSAGAFAFTQTAYMLKLVISNDKCSSSLQVECWNEDETHAVQQSPTQF